MSRPEDWTDKALDNLAKELPVYEADPARADSVRAAIVVTVAASPGPRSVRPRRRRMVAGLAASLALVTSVLLWRATGPGTENTRQAQELQTVRHGSIIPGEGLQYALLSAAPDERIRLTEGRMTVEVEKLGPGERFRVITGDAEVEVWGTVFEIDAHSDRLLRVRVLEGRVEVRPAGRPSVMLLPDEVWPAPPAASATPTPAPPMPQARARSAPKRKAVRPTHEAGAPPVSITKPPPSALMDKGGESDFLTGWEAFRNQRPEDAAVAFANAVRAAGDSPLAEDARFWEAAALEQAGRSGPATDALRSFLKDYPQSSRTGEASAMLGWLCLRSANLEEARTRFGRALQDPSPDVRSSARKGLIALERLSPLLPQPTPAP